MIIVTGVGRSGTSAVARVLHESGVSMGRDFAEPTEFNPTGYYEERPVVALNGALLAACGLDRWFGYASRSEVLAAAEPHRGEMACLAGTIAGGQRPERVEGWKDPRFCWTLEAWLPHLPRWPRLIVCLRSPEAVIASTLRRYGQTKPRAREAVAYQWSMQYRRLLAVIHDFALEAICIEYEELVAHPEETVGRLAQFVGRLLEPTFVDGSLRHEAAPLPPRFAPLYERVRNLSQAAQSAARRATSSL